MAISARWTRELCRDKEGLDGELSDSPLSCPRDGPRGWRQEGGDAQGAPMGNVMGNAWPRPVRQLRPAQQVPFWQGS